MKFCDACGPAATCGRGLHDVLDMQHIIDSETLAEFALGKQQHRLQPLVLALCPPASRVNEEMIPTFNIRDALTPVHGQRALFAQTNAKSRAPKHLFAV